jgi:hypothetical protein
VPLNSRSLPGARIMITNTSANPADLGAANVAPGRCWSVRILRVSSDQRSRTLAWAQHERALSTLKIVHSRVIYQPLVWIKDRRVLVLVVLAVAALAVSALLGIPAAWRLGPQYFEAIGTWVGALGGIAAILVAGGALYHQRTTDLRAQQARKPNMKPSGLMSSRELLSSATSGCRRTITVSGVWMLRLQC